MEFEIFVTTGLGDNSYLVWSGDQAMLVDPQRDVWRFLEAARKRGLSIRWVIETHVHNDYISGARAVPSTWSSRSGCWPRPSSDSLARSSEMDQIGSNKEAVMDTPIVGIRPRVPVWRA
jgi:glyoxylase-like metal-dependent hydrolase (beta-lactamase superfamily II)